LLKTDNIGFLISVFYFTMEAWTSPENCILTKANKEKIKRLCHFYWNRDLERKLL